jgi:hypothetical protein
VDCENLTDKQCFSVGLNAYFNLLPMADESVSHGEEYVSRAQMLSILNRAEYSVDQKTSVYETDDLEAIVGESIYNESAAKEVAVNYCSPSYLPTDDGSLDSETYHATVSRGEAIYSVFMSVYYCEGAMLMADLDSAELTDAANGGDIQSEQNLSSKAEALNYALRHPDQGCPEDIYKALVRANEIGAISDETTWEEAITLSDLISLYYDIAVYRFVSSKSGTTRAIEESEGWPEYKETMEYYVENGLISEECAFMLNPDIYGTLTYGKGTENMYYGTGSAHLGCYLKELITTTTKGYTIYAYWYTETNTVQFIYIGEVLPGGSWLADLFEKDSASTALEAAYPEIFEESGAMFKVTHQQKIDALGEPSLTAEEVIDEITNGTADYVKRLVLETTKGYLIQACWNMNDNTVEYIYPGDDTQYEWYRGSFVETSDALALAGKYKGTREEKIEVVGEPSLSPEEVIAAFQ